VLCCVVLCCALCFRLFSSNCHVCVGVCVFLFSLFRGWAGLGFRLGSGAEGVGTGMGHGDFWTLLDQDTSFALDGLHFPAGESSAPEADSGGNDLSETFSALCGSGSGARRLMRFQRSVAVSSPAEDRAFERGPGLKVMWALGPAGSGSNGGIIHERRGWFDLETAPGACSLDPASLAHVQDASDCTVTLDGGTCAITCLFRDAPAATLTCGGGVYSPDVSVSPPCPAPRGCVAAITDSDGACVDVSHGATCTTTCLCGDVPLTGTCVCADSEFERPGVPGEAAALVSCPAGRACASAISDSDGSCDSVAHGQSCTVGCLHAAEVSVALDCWDGGFRDPTDGSAVSSLPVCPGPGGCGQSFAYADGGCSALASGESCVVSCLHGDQLAHEATCANGVLSFSGGGSGPVCVAPASCPAWSVAESDGGCGDELAHGGTCGVACLWEAGRSFAVRCLDGVRVLSTDGTTPAAGVVSCAAPSGCGAVGVEHTTGSCDGLSHGDTCVLECEAASSLTQGLGCWNGALVEPGTTAAVSALLRCPQVKAYDFQGLDLTGGSGDLMISCSVDRGSSGLFEVELEFTADR